jgi:hypothetical protein
MKLSRAWLTVRAASSWIQCKGLCMTSSSCQFFTFNIPSSKCHLADRVSGKTNTSTDISGVKFCRADFNQTSQYCWLKDQGENSALMKVNKLVLSQSMHLSLCLSVSLCLCLSQSLSLSFHPRPFKASSWI